MFKSFRIFHIPNITALFTALAAISAFVVLPVEGKQAAAPRNVDFLQIEPLAKTIIGTWDIRDVDDLSDRCGSNFSVSFLPNGLYEDDDGRGKYTVSKRSVSISTRDDAGRIFRSTSKVVEIISRDQLILDNGKEKYGLRRCAPEREKAAQLR